MSYSHSRHWSLVGIRPRLAQASCTAAVHSRQLMELGEPPAAMRVPAWLPPDADRLPVGSPENDMNVLKEIVDRTLLLLPHGKTQPDISIRLPRRDESLTSGTLFLRLSIMMLHCRQRCSSYLSLSTSWLTHPLELDSFSSFSVPAPSGMVDVSDCGQRSSRLLILPVLGSLEVLMGKPHYGCLVFFIDLRHPIC